MSYIGKNPKVDSVKLDGSATVPTGASVEGQVYYNTGTGSISKGLKVYKNSQFVSIDKQLGDADTFHLLKASDLAVSEWSGARNSTSTSYLNQNSVPHETTTASGVAGTFSNSSTGDALLTDESSDLVFNYKSSGTSDDAQEYFGIPLTIPKAFRGGNVVLSFVYRTENDGSDATADGQFEVGILDKSSGNGGQTTSTNSTTDIGAGSAITVASKTGLAVNQRIRLEAGSQAAIGSPDATVVESYITSVSGTANEITIAKDWDTPHAAGAAVVSGWLTDVVQGQLPGADSDTNKQGKSFSLQFKTEDDTSDIVLWFQNKNTSSTDSFELFVDNILFSANKFLQASSQTQSETYLLYSTTFWDATGHEFDWDHASLESRGGSPLVAQSKLLRFEDNAVANPAHSTHAGTRIYARKDITINLTIACSMSNTKELYIYDSTGSNAPGITYNNSGGNETHSLCLAGYKLAKDDYLSVGSNGLSARDGWFTVSATPEASPVVILESQDEIFTAWVDYTDVFNTASWWSGGANTISKAMWRRVGGNMEIKVDFHVAGTGTASTDYAIIKMPPGYSIDINKTGGEANTVVGNFFKTYSTAAFLADGAGGIVTVRDDYPQYLYMSYQAASSTAIAINSINAFVGVNEHFFVNISVPVQGWNANFNPLLSMPLVDLGQPVEGWVVPFDNANNFWDATGTCFLFNKALLKPYPNGAAGTIADSKFISIQDQTSGTNTVTSVKAKQDIILNISANGWLDSSAYIEIYSSADQLLGADQQFNSSNYSGDISRTVELKAGDYVYCKNQGYSRHGGMTLTAQKIQSGNMAHIIKPAVAIGYEVLAKDTNGGNSTGGGYKQRKWNVWEGETWFVSDFDGTLGVGGTTDTFSLDPGTYKIDGYTTAYKSNGSFSTMLSTDSSIEIFGTNGRPGSGDDVNVLLPFGGVITLTEKKAFQVWTWTATLQSTYGLGVEIGTSTSAVAGRPEKYCRIIIEKLK